MKTEFDIMQNLIAARRERLSLQRKVVDWMTAQGQQGNLVYSNQAPFCAEFEAADIEWQHAVFALDGWLQDHRPTPEGAWRVSIRLEIFSESNPREMHASGEVEAVPDVGDFVQTTMTDPDSGDAAWWGYVRRRRWTFDGKGLASVRVWVHKEPRR